MKNIYNNVFHLNKLPGHKRSSPLLISSLLRDRTGKIYTVCCNTYALSFIFARIFKMMTYLHVELHQFLLLARSSLRSFCERRNPFTILIHWVELTWCSPRAPRICGNLWNIAHSRTNERATKLRIPDLRQVVALTTGTLRFKLTFSPIDYTRTRTRTLQLCFVLPNKIRFHSRSVIDYVKYC